MDLEDLIQQAVILIAVALIMGLMVIGMLHLMGVSIKPAQTAKVVIIVTYEDNGYHFEEQYEFVGDSKEREVFLQNLKEELKQKGLAQAIPSLVDKLPFKHYISII